MPITSEMRELLSLFECPHPAAAYKPHLRPNDWRKRESERLVFRSDIPDRLETVYLAAIDQGYLVSELLMPKEQVEWYELHPETEAAQRWNQEKVEWRNRHPNAQWSIVPSWMDAWVTMTPTGWNALNSCEEGESPVPKRTRTGRPRKGERDKQPLVLAALAQHHGYQVGGSVSTYEPATVKQIAKLASDKAVKVSTATVSRFLQDKFKDKACKGHKGYVASCNRDARLHIGMLLSLWCGELPERLASLLPHESGREDDE